MRSTNSKEARRAVEIYLLGCLEDRKDNYSDPDPARPISWAFDILRAEMRYQSDETESGYPVMGEGLAKKYREAGRHGFIAANTPYWVMYLAVSAGCFDICYNQQRAAVASWLDETPEEAARYNNDKVYSLYRCMISKAFERLYERETTPRRIPISEFKRIYQEHNAGYFFDRDTMRYYHQRMSDINVSAFYLVTDERGAQRDCYRVESWQRTDYDERRHCAVWYFDRETLQAVFPAKKEA